MNVIELQRALRQLRCSGMAGGLEARLLEAQAEKLVALDFLSRLVQDELVRRQDRLFERRLKQAGFRDPDKRLDTFDFDFNKKMNRALVFELATARWITQHADALFFGPPGSGKSHLAQAIGFAVIQQGHRVLYREAHVLLDDLAEAQLAGTRKEYVTSCCRTCKNAEFWTGQTRCRPMAGAPVTDGVRSPLTQARGSCSFPGAILPRAQQLDDRAAPERTSNVRARFSAKSRVLRFPTIVDTSVTTVPLLIIDDLGMRKLPQTAAEDLLELVMRRYEKASTLITSNRPVEDWGKLLGDTAAVAALLDRLLHHAHVLTCGPRSWRTRLHTDRHAS